ncbi:hypothetical protein FACS189455_2500 [Bacteroidia bacterium]|nr:hypothetical protein FACS189455_2500 [Bacteroidia bacterium]
MGLAIAQNKQVSGTVVDESEDPVAGASVLEKGTSAVKAITDINGKFSFSVQQSVNTLVIKYLGYADAEVTAGTNVLVTLTPDTKILGEVVVTALGLTKDQKAIPYAAALVNNEELTRAGQRSALNALQGKVPGVSITSNSGAPGASSRIVLRGYSSITGSNEPLFVVDGVPISNNASQGTGLGNNHDFGNSVNDINPGDIENITILKGAAASALYGSRAANGVILITTKSGSTKSKMTIDYTGSVKF